LLYFGGTEERLFEQRRSGRTFEIHDLFALEFPRAESAGKLAVVAGGFKRFTVAWRDGFGRTKFEARRFLRIFVLVGGYFL
jgi:hypothetical protein